MMMALSRRSVSFFCKGSFHKQALSPRVILAMNFSVQREDHSEFNTESASQDDDSEIKRAILTSSLPFVHQYGYVFPYND